MVFARIAGVPVRGAEHDSQMGRAEQDSHAPQCGERLRLFKRSELEKFLRQVESTGSSNPSERSDVDGQRLAEKQEKFPQFGPKVSKPSGTLMPSPRRVQPLSLIE